MVIPGEPKVALGLKSLRVNIHNQNLPPLLLSANDKHIIFPDIFKPNNWRKASLTNFSPYLALSPGTGSVLLCPVLGYRHQIWDRLMDLWCHLTPRCARCLSLTNILAASPLSGHSIARVIPRVHLNVYIIRRWRDFYSKRFIFCRHSEIILFFFYPTFNNNKLPLLLS